MSQVYKNLASGPVPPTVATQYNTDVNSPAIPAANILIVPGGTSSVNNNNGIRTDGSSGGNTLTIQLTNRVQATATTSDGGGQTQNVTLIAPANATAVTFKVTVVGYDSANNLAVGGEQIGLARTTAGAPVVVGTNDTFDEADVAIGAADWNVIASGANLVMQFVGVAGHSIAWRALFEYTQVP